MIELDIMFKINYQFRNLLCIFRKIHIHKWFKIYFKKNFIIEEYL